VYETEENRCYILSTRDILAGEEIFVSYTKEYWDCVKYNISIGRGRK
jgi:SET domain-containing protein